LDHGWCPHRPFVSGVSAVIDVRPRAVGSEHFVTTDFNPFAAVAGVFTDHTKRRGSSLHEPHKRQLKEK
jgi:hypothetical protein